MRPNSEATSIDVTGTGQRAKTLSYAAKYLLSASEVAKDWITAISFLSVESTFGTDRRSLDP